MPKSGRVVSVVAELKNERASLQKQLTQIKEALTILETSNGASSNGSRRTLSAAGRRRIAAAQRARWAKVRAKKA